MDAKTQRKFDDLTQEFDTKIVEQEKMQDNPKDPKYHELYWRCKDILSKTSMMAMQDTVDSFKSFK